MKYFIYFILSLAYISIFTTAKKVCVNPEGKEVDWFVVFLFPETSNKNVKLSYGYYDDSLTNMKYVEYSDKTFPGIKAIMQFEQANTDYFIWNDDATTEEGEKSSSSNGKAHSKGGLIFDKTSGILFSHSLPRFPLRTDKNKVIASFPDNAGIYGQTFICINMNYDNAIKVAETLNLINPPLLVNIEDDVLQKPGNPEILKLIKNRQDSKLPNTKITEIKSLKGDAFTIFSKSRNEETLPYDVQIPAYYKDGLFVETWTKPVQIPSICKGENLVINVNELQFGDFAYNKNQEHSKWAVGIKKDVCCFGDLNRCDSQRKRGGNVICFINKKLAGIMRGAIKTVESCPKKLNFLEE
jgi:hypothetical protein